jgi:multicomponent Na+:H+ antiporter subunit G
VFILLLLFFTAPVVTHALAQAALHENIAPLLTEDHRNRMAGQPAGHDEGRPSSKP